MNTSPVTVHVPRPEVLTVLPSTIGLPTAKRLRWVEHDLNASDQSDDKLRELAESLDGLSALSMTVLRPESTSQPNKRPWNLKLLFLWLRIRHHLTQI